MLPTLEDEQTILPCSILDGLEDDIVGNIIEETYGRIQIMDGKILRDMPEGQSKANIAFQWFSQYRCCLDLENANHSFDPAEDREVWLPWIDGRISARAKNREQYPRT